MGTNKYILSCTEGHPNEVELNDLIDALETDRCEECGSHISDSNPKVIELECPCGYSEPYDVEEAKSLLNLGCPNANEDIEAPDNIKFHHLSARNSSQALFYTYKWNVHGPQHKQLMMKEMQDYWEYLIHFTDDAGFLSIMETHAIVAHSTGYFHNLDPAGSKSVCLTETPLEYADRFFKNYGLIGFVFKKADLQMLGALPVMVLSKEMIKAQERLGGFARELKPFVQLLRTASTGGVGPRYDWISDREWRVPTTIHLSQIRPVGMVYKEPITYRADEDPIWRAKIYAATNFGEIKLN